MLAVIETHPIQYRGPLYRMLQRDLHVPVTVIYGSDFSVAGYRDPDFGAEFNWDVDLLSGYDSIFLSRVKDGGARDLNEVKSAGLGEALRRLRPKAVLISGYRPGYHRAGFWHAWRAGLPILFRGETTDMEHGGALRKTLRSLILPSMYQRCQRVLYIGQSARKHYVEHGCPENKLIFSPYFVNTEPFQPEGDGTAVRRQFGISDGHKVILFSGKLTEIKRPYLLAEAVRGVEGVSVIFLGDGPLRDRVASIGGNIHFAGFQNQTKISPYYHAADLLCLPSSWDTWGLVVNEALFHGLPCVVSDRVGCAADLITPGTTGEVFANGSVSDLRDAIQRVLPRAGQPAVTMACRERAAQYSMRRAADGIVEAYRVAVGA